MRKCVLGRRCADRMRATFFFAALALWLSPALSIALAQTTLVQSELIRGNVMDPASLDPHRLNTVYESNIAQDLFEGLIAPDATGAPAPGLAESWTVSPDGLTWTFMLRSGLVWSDGRPITSDDVVGSLRRLMDPATASQFPYLLYGLANAQAVNTGEAPVESLGVSAPDERTVVLTLANPVPYLPELLSNAFASVVPLHVIAVHGSGWTAPEVIVSNGAYVLEDWRPQDRVVLARNPAFHAADTVAVERIVYLPTEDQTSALAMFRAGELDTSMEFPTARTEWLRQNLPEETKISPALATYYFSFNTQRPALSDPRVRRALSLAIDRATLANRVLRAGETPSTGLVPPQIANYTSPAPPLLEPAEAQRQARALLVEAGYGPDNPLRLSLSLSSAEDRRRAAAAIAAMWQPLGVELSLDNTEGRVLFARLRTGDFDIGYSAWVADVNDAANFLAILGGNAVNSNYARYDNPVYDDLLAQAAATPDAAGRAALLAEAERVLLADAPIAPLYTPVNKNLVARHVGGWQANARDVHLSRYLYLTGSRVDLD